MLVITNRNLSKKLIKTGRDSGEAFGEQQNEKGITEIRLAHAKYKNNEWTVDLVKEKDIDEIDKDNLPSKKEFLKLISRCREGKKNCLFFIHGYNKTFEETLEQARLLESKYNTEVVLFSWPSNTGGTPISEYENVRSKIGISSSALDNILNKASYYAKTLLNSDATNQCEISLNLLVYSMGNFLFQRYIESQDYDLETSIFTNIILCQADCDNKNHPQWVEKIATGKRVYITIHEEDKTLKWSDLNFQKDRLGRTAKNLNSKNAIYIDFTDGHDEGRNHQIWGDEASPKTTRFFELVLNGKRGETLDILKFNSRTNAFELI